MASLWLSSFSSAFTYVTCAPLDCSVSRVRGALLSCLFAFNYVYRFCALPWSRATAACVCRLALARLALTRDILGRLLGGKATIADALHRLVAVWVGFTTKSVQSATASGTAFSTTFMDVRAMRGAVWNPAQFACRTGNLAYTHCSLCCRHACVFSRSSSSSSSSSRARFYTDVEAAMGREPRRTTPCKRPGVYLSRVRGLHRAALALFERLKVSVVSADWDMSTFDPPYRQWPL